jgi:hypothetical protein
MPEREILAILILRICRDEGLTYCNKTEWSVGDRDEGEDSDIVTLSDGCVAILDAGNRRFLRELSVRVINADEIITTVLNSHHHSIARSAQSSDQT